jgi:alpha-N-arabinofuranosidase
MRLPSVSAGNVFAKSAKPSKYDTGALLKPDFDLQPKLTERPDGWYLEFTFDKVWATEQTRKLVTTELLGFAKIPNLPFENPDGTPLRIATDYFGKRRNAENPFPGPFETPQSGTQTIKVWPKP